LLEISKGFLLRLARRPTLQGGEALLRRFQAEARARDGLNVVLDLSAKAFCEANCERDERLIDAAVRVGDLRRGLFIDVTEVALGVLHAQGRSNHLLLRSACSVEAVRMLSAMAGHSRAMVVVRRWAKVSKVWTDTPADAKAASMPVILRVVAPNAFAKRLVCWIASACPSTNAAYRSGDADESRGNERNGGREELHRARAVLGRLRELVEGSKPLLANFAQLLDDFNIAFKQDFLDDLFKTLGHYPLPRNC
jgi:hypothetical protein